jgi:hypothetical protein
MSWKLIQIWTADTCSCCWFATTGLYINA